MQFVFRKTFRAFCAFCVRMILIIRLIREIRVQKLSVLSVLSVCATFSNSICFSDEVPFGSLPLNMITCHDTLQHVHRFLHFL